jgi:hypothetical protein
MGGALGVIVEKEANGILFTSSRAKMVDIGKVTRRREWCAIGGLPNHGAAAEFRVCKAERGGKQGILIVKLGGEGTHGVLSTLEMFGNRFL